MRPEVAEAFNAIAEVLIRKLEQNLTSAPFYGRIAIEGIFQATRCVHTNVTVSTTERGPEIKGRPLNGSTPERRGIQRPSS